MKNYMFVPLINKYNQSVWISTDSTFTTCRTSVVNSCFSYFIATTTVRNVVPMGTFRMLSDNKTIPTAINRRKESLLIPEEVSFWKEIFSLPNKCIQSRWMQTFQYKILRRILPTNKMFFQYKIKPSSSCDYFGPAEESLNHLFCECDITTENWQEIVDWLGKQIIKTEYLTDSQILLGEIKFWPSH